MRGKRASGTKHARIRETIYRIFEHGKSFIPNFVAFFVFSGSASSCISNISDSQTLAKREFTPAILFLFDLRIIHSVGGKKCSLARDSEPIRLRKTPRSLSVYILIVNVGQTYCLTLSLRGMTVLLTF